MKVMLLSGSIELVKKVLPAWVYKSVKDREHKIFGLMERSSLLGVAVFVQAYDVPDQSVLKYIYIKPEHSGKGYSKVLLSGAEQLLKKFGAKTVLCRYVGYDNVKGRMLSMLMGTKYLPLSVHGQIVSYFLADMQQSDFGRNLSKFEPLMEFVKSIDEVPEMEVKAFAYELSERGFPVNLSQIDREYCRFYIENGKIMACLLISRIGETAVLLGDSFIDPGLKNKYAIPIMIASMLEVAGKVMPEEAVFFLQLFDSGIIGGIKNVFGEPESVDQVFEFLKRI